MYGAEVNLDWVATVLVQTIWRLSGPKIFLVPQNFANEVLLIVNSNTNNRI